MKKYLILSIVVCFLAGCSMTQAPSQTSQLRIQVAQLERQVREKDDRIAELEYDIRDLQAQAEANADYLADEPAERVRIAPSVEIIDSSVNAYPEIIRISASAQQVQIALKNAGYYNGAIDGKIGTKSKQAIKDFQKDHNLKVDGIIGKQSWEALKNYLSE